jgi:hypothetical protein
LGNELQEDLGVLPVIQLVPQTQSDSENLKNKLMIFFIPKLLVKNVRQELPYGKFIAQLVILATCKIPIWHDLTNYLK